MGVEYNWYPPDQKNVLKTGKEGILNSNEADVFGYMFDRGPSKGSAGNKQS